MPKALPLKPNFGYASQFRMRNPESATRTRRSALVPLLVFLVAVFASLSFMDNARQAHARVVLHAESHSPVVPPAALDLALPDPALSVIPTLSTAPATSALADPLPPASNTPSPTPAADLVEPIPLKYPVGAHPSRASGERSARSPSASQTPSMMVPDAPTEPSGG